MTTPVLLTARGSGEPPELRACSTPRRTGGSPVRYWVHARPSRANTARVLLTARGSGEPPELRAAELPPPLFLKIDLDPVVRDSYPPAPIRFLNSCRQSTNSDSRSTTRSPPLQPSLRPTRVANLRAHL